MLQPLPTAQNSALHIETAPLLALHPVEVALLHDRLRREFIDKRHDYVADYCDGSFIWEKDKPAFKPFVLPGPVKLPAWADWLANAIVAGILALFGFGFHWFVVR